MEVVTFELTIRDQDGLYIAGARLYQHTTGLDATLAAHVPLQLDVEALRVLALQPSEYGAYLTRQLFGATDALRGAWTSARGYADGAQAHLRLSLRLDAGSDALHAVRWETILDPVNQTPLATDPRIHLVRYLESPSTRSIAPVERSGASTVFALASPTDLESYGLAVLDLDGETDRLRAALDGRPLTVIGRRSGAPSGQATLRALIEILRTSPTILCLECHARYLDGDTILWFENEHGLTERVRGATLAEIVAQAERPPLLVVLLACQSGGDHLHTEALSFLGPRLARAGVGAVLALQGAFSLEAARRFLPAFFQELYSHGAVDRAVSAARASLRDGEEWWRPALWMRFQEVRLWRAGPGGGPLERDRDAKIRAAVLSHAGIMEARLKAFVGRARELAAIRAQIGQLAPTGGYLVIAGRAGQGKSSVIARLVADAEAALAGAGGESSSRPRVLHHFIPLETGADYQVTVLRDLIAQLVLKHELPNLYIESEQKAVLKEYFAAILRQISELGLEETIYLDGIDQIEVDSSGFRDLSFLPPDPPKGIVIVIGTRPDDSLQPLHIRKPRAIYNLPNLSRDDFAQILSRRGVTLDRVLIDQFYNAVQQHALYLDLVARELSYADALPVEEVIAQVAEDPDNIFSLSIHRLSRGALAAEWKATTRPILAALLVAREPLSSGALRVLVGQDSYSVKVSLQRLGGLVADTGQGKHYLYHTKFRDFLREDPARPTRSFLFDAAEEQDWHRRLAAWATPRLAVQSASQRELAQPGPEQERLLYAGRHCISHLAATHAWDEVWRIVDDWAYGRARVRRDHSERAYTLDLNTALQGCLARSGAGFDERLRLLPRVWRYSLLRDSLKLRADLYPSEVLQAFAALGQEQEAMGLVELIAEPSWKAWTLVKIAQILYAHPEKARELKLITVRAREAIYAIPDLEGRTRLFDSLESLGDAEHGQGFTSYCLDELGALLPRLRARASVHQRVQLLADLARSGAAAGAVPAICREVLAETTTMPDHWLRFRLQTMLAYLCFAAGHHDWSAAWFVQARASLTKLPNGRGLARALGLLAIYLAHCDRQEDAARQLAAAKAAMLSAADKEDVFGPFTYIAGLMAKVGRHEDAREIRELIPLKNSTARAAIELAIARGCADGGRADLALRVLARLDKVDGAKSGSGKAKPDDRTAELVEEVLSEVATRISQAGDFDQALALTRERLSGLRAEAALATIATHLAVLGEFARAGQTLAHVGEQALRIPALAVLGVRVARSGDPDQGEAYLQKAHASLLDIPGERTRDEVRKSLAIAFAQHQAYERSLACLATIADIRVKAETIGQLAMLFARRRPLPEAQELLQLTERLLAQAHASDTSDAIRAAHCLLLPQVQRDAEAGPAIQAIRNRQTALGAWRGLATVLDKLGRHEQLAELVRQVWTRADSRGDLLALLSVGGPLLSLRPELGLAIVGSIQWVDSLLEGEL